MVTQRHRQFPELIFGLVKALERRRASQNPEQPARVLVERSSNETLTLSAGHIKVYKVWDGRSGEEAAAFQLTPAPGLTSGGRGG